MSTTPPHSPAPPSDNQPPAPAAGAHTPGQQADIARHIETFITQLRDFATGSYLRPEERELWTQPFDPQALEELHAILKNAAAACADASFDPDRLREELTSMYLELLRFNERHGRAVIEPEEIPEIDHLARLLGTTGGDPIENLPTWEEINQAWEEGKL